MDCIVDYFTFSAVYFLAVVIVLAKPLKPTFKSYLLPVQTDLKKAPQPPIKKLEAKLLPGTKRLCNLSSMIMDMLFIFMVMTLVGKCQDQVDSFIVAFVEPEMVICYPGVETKTSVTKHHGESVNLACNFTVAKDYSSLPFSVYWIKTISGNSSTCLYSYSYDSHGELYDHHCLIDEALLKRRSNTSSIPLTNPIFHNLKISNATYSDSGQYVCALQVLKNRKGHWKVITNVTVTVNGEFNNHTNRNDTAPLYTPGDPYIPLYVVGALFFSCLFVTAIVIVMMKNTKISQAESHTLRMKREQDGEETLNSDCSPYAEGRGEDEGLFSLLKLTEVRDPVTAQNGAEEHAAVAVEQYSVVMLNTEYEASDPQATQTSSTCPLRIGAKI
ncbi:uncharacterized protein [Salvelinus alpinus]|uniref:uncharacterized protein isoform X5 n=2 Tax=Salvelinus alpinus TaxID=8036 RepID=UPI0039FDCB96